LLVVLTCGLSLFAARPPALAQSGAISGLVFADGNGNGLHDPGEEGVAGVTIAFSGVGEPVTGMTNADGSYFFTASLGTWTVTITPPPGFEAVNGPTQAVTIAAAEQSMVLDFGLRPIQMLPTETSPPPPPGPSETPGILPTTGARVATRPLVLGILVILFALGAGLFLSALRRKQPRA
jgi:hypothetical protein